MSAASYSTPKFDQAVDAILKIFTPKPHLGFRVKNGPLNSAGQNKNTFLILSFLAERQYSIEDALTFFHEHLDYVKTNPDLNDHQNLRALLKIDSKVLVKDIFEIGKVFDINWLQEIIDDAWENRVEFGSFNPPEGLPLAVETALKYLNEGTLRVASKENGKWVVHQWLKKAVLLSFKLNPNVPMGQGDLQFYDKVESKFGDMTKAELQATGVRIVPPAFARHGGYIATGVILMPSFVNIGAYVGEGTMVDTWAAVGSCAQIGKNVHLSGGVGIGGVLEPMQANPTIIEDNCFIGARSEVVEGVIVEENSVLGMGVYIGQSTPIYDRETDTISYGRVPAGSVVVSGNLLKAGGKYSLYCVVIVKKVDAQTRAKTSINDLLRD